MEYMYLKLVLLSYVAGLSSCLSDTEIYNELFGDYKKQLFPNWSSKEKVNITINAYPISLAQFAEMEEKISMMVSFQFTWNDPRLKWDGYKFNQTYSLFVSPDDIWLPNFYLSNAVDELRPLGHESVFYAFVVVDGTVIWTPGEILEAQCTPNVFRFPFDTQNCSFFLMMWGVFSGMEFHIPSDKPVMTYFYPNSDWELVNIIQVVPQKSPIFIISLEIKRQSMYYVVTVALPTILFAFMNPLVFCLPVESGERISLGMTILLSYAIFLTIVSTSIPAKSNPFCVAILVLVLIMIVSGIIVFLLIITMHYYYKTETDDVNSCLKYLARKCRRKRKGRKNEYIQEAEDDEVTGPELARVLDIIFCVTSYILFLAFILGYVVFIFVTN